MKQTWTPDCPSFASADVNRHKFERTSDLDHLIELVIAEFQSAERKQAMADLDDRWCLVFETNTSSFGSSEFNLLAESWVQQLRIVVERRRMLSV